jgi:hypothetical protein
VVVAVLLAGGEVAGEGEGLQEFREVESAVGVRGVVVDGSSL